jgi:hypothetical protein
MKYAIVNSDNLVVNIVAWDGVSKWLPPKDHIVIQSDQANIGDKYDAQTGNVIKNNLPSTDPIAK